MDPMTRSGYGFCEGLLGVISTSSIPSPSTRLLMGTDYPFPVADFDPLKTVEGIPGFAEDEPTAFGEAR